MEFGFSPKQEKLHAEVRQFFLDEMPEDLEAGTTPLGAGYSAISAGLQDFWMSLQKKAGKLGYLTPGWPKELGGMGLSSIEQGVIHEEEGRAGVAWPNLMGLQLAAPATILFGTEQQKKRFIPPTTRGEVVWFQAFTEPEAGSDTANVQLRGVEDGDAYVLRGLHEVPCVQLNSYGRP